MRESESADSTTNYVMNFFGIVVTQINLSNMKQGNELLWASVYIIVISLEGNI